MPAVQFCTIVNDLYCFVELVYYLLAVDKLKAVCFLSYRVAGVLGYLPQDLIGQVSYEYYNPDDIQKMVQLHHEGINQLSTLPIYILPVVLH